MPESLPQTSRIEVVTDPAVNGYLLAQWAVERLDDEDIQTVTDLGAYRAYGIVRNDSKKGIQPLAVVIFNWFRELPHGNDMRVIVVAESPRWCLPGVLRELFKYPFELAGCARLTAAISERNQRSLKLCKGLGFKKEGVLRRAHDGKTNTIVLSMLPHECKWLEQPPSKEEQRSQDGQKIAFSSSPSRPRKNRRRPKRRKQGSVDRERAA